MKMNTPMPTEKAVQEFAAWFAGLPTYKGTGELPARGTVAAALVVLEHLKQNYQLDLDAHRAPGQSQLQGLNPAALRKILAQFGETRKFLAEGGRTNRGAPGDVAKMLQTLRSMNLDGLSATARNAVLEQFQAFLVERVKEYHGRKRLQIDYDAGKTTWVAVHNLLRQAAEVGKAGPVAQYLVGAKLELRFPDATISNERFSAADAQKGRLGDFEVGDTAFHVTVSPMPGVYDRCRKNIAQGCRVYLLVPDDYVVGARQNAEAIAPERIAVESLESFIANNIEELSAFSKERLVGGFRRLLEAYNRRVGAIELDKSLLIEIPRGLQ